MRSSTYSIIQKKERGKKINRTNDEIFVIENGMMSLVRRRNDRYTLRTSCLRSCCRCRDCVLRTHTTRPIQRNITSLLLVYSHLSVLRYQVAPPSFLLFLLCTESLFLLVLLVDVLFVVLLYLNNFLRHNTTPKKGASLVPV